MHFVSRVTTIAAAVALAACSRGPASGGSAPLDARPFAGFAAQTIIVAPTGSARGGDTLGWVDRMGGSRGAARHLDSSIARVLADRGLADRWILPAALQRTYERNRSYATDPYRLAIEPLRAPAVATGARVGEPLSSQLRTMIALEAEARMVLLPVELRFERDGAGLRGALRLCLIDPRTATVSWVGDVKGDASTDLTRALSSVAARVADLFVAP